MFFKPFSVLMTEIIKETLPMYLRTLFLSTIILSYSMSVFAVNVIDKIEKLPITGVQMVKAGDKNILMSNNGRFIFEGVFDTWNNKSILTTEDVVSYAQRIDIDQLSINLDDLHHYSFGKGKETVIIFVDPNCAYCAKMLDEVSTLEDKYIFKILPIGILGKDSQLKVNGLSCSDDDKSIITLMNHSYTSDDAVIKGCQPEKQLKTLATAQIIGVTAVPFMIAPNNKVRKGGFNIKGQLGQYLATNHE